ncbi:asparagine synthase (glutamine-hydrolyzing) [Clostridium transplantifaecale]|uniref:asparagine synthase (glutamine-hydrolyzing) n=1 Tax=Clostridium transplantifaecale TaxID=2479838 RepID=UPI000F6369DD|nr:asparagine synthase (glutamine-hydrolyzing) [Clostridium transplantifaecale]
MCGIAGFFNPNKDFTQEKENNMNILDAMNRAQKRRGPDDEGCFLNEHFGLAQVRLSIVDLVTGHQPMIGKDGSKGFGIVYNGELYNTEELREELRLEGHSFDTSGDTEVLLKAYQAWGSDFITRVNGIFALAIMDTSKNRLLLCRDRSGIKPLFYTVRKDSDTVIFGSELKALLAFPGIRPEVDKKGLNEIFSIGPARTSGCGVYKNIHEVLPGHFLSCTLSGNRQEAYWKLESHVHTDSFEDTVEKTGFLLRDAVKRQMVSDVPICTFLSGGVDSSLVSAVCAEELKKQNRRLHTYSFDFTGNAENFKASSFQPSQDRPYVDKMVDFLGSEHTYLECSTKDQADLLFDSVKAHDLPAMADVDSSLLYFCSLVAKQHKVTLTGECADEIFGGYPWFHKKECFLADTFPWTMDLEARKVLLSDDFLDYLRMDDYVKQTYDASIAEVPKLDGENAEEARRREISYLNLRWFMQTLLNRMDRTSMYSGLEARVPFADHRIIEYLFNVPWEMKARGGVAKALLREAGRGLLPDEILFRRKSPYPKTYDRNYEALLAGRVRDILGDSSSPVLPFLDKKKVERFLESPSDYGKPWYGQLMAAPQLMAYLIQVDFWMREYGVIISC